MYKYFLRPLLFLLPAEQAHYLVLESLAYLCKFSVFKIVLQLIFAYNKSHLSLKVVGLHFRNPVGVAAGLDKNGKYLKVWDALGFGFVEVGTVTPRAQQGHTKPRLFRIRHKQALINHMGFNNEGLEVLQRRLQGRPKTLVIGVNLGKQKETPLEAALQDYILLFQSLFSYGDYFVINISSPNTKDLRKLSAESYLSKILSSLQQYNFAQTITKPLFVKISPDMSEEELHNVARLAEKYHISGLIATNTSTTLHRHSVGGLSGAPLMTQATKCLNIVRSMQKKLVLIGVGGVCSAEHALEKRQAGADLVQLYTGLVYEGPKLLKDILKSWRVDRPNV